MEEEKVKKNGSALLVLKLKSVNFSLAKAVCNHGFFMMSPNQWNPDTKTLYRPLRLADCTTCVDVCISQAEADSTNDNEIHIWVHNLYDLSLSCADDKAIKRQVGRMLRLSDKDERAVTELHQLHSVAKETGFGRLFRSPSLFEDAVKSMLLCNCMWSRSLKMAESLCHLQLQLTNCKTKSGNFPTAKELASLDEQQLEKRCNLGYRAKNILKLAKDVQTGLFKLDKLDDQTLHCKQLYNKLSKRKGFGPFTCANVLMGIGIYELVPIDSETIRHIQQTHGKKCDKNTVKELYDQYAPFQCLAYWMELLDYYEAKLGKLSELPNSCYHAATGSLIKDT